MSNTVGVLAVTQLAKRFGQQRVIDSLSFNCSSGDIVLLLGANGAGKSTLLRLLSGLLRPDSGKVSLSAGARVGLVSHHSFLYGRLSVSENLALYRRLIGAASSNQDALVREWDLERYLKTPVYQLSKGTQGKVSLVRALLGEPQALLLDEPSSNLDQGATENLKRVLAAQRSKGVAVVATHDVARLEGAATRVLLLERGKCVADSGSDGAEATRREVIQRYYEANR